MFVFWYNSFWKKNKHKICSKRTNVIDFVYFRCFLCMYFFGGGFQDRISLHNPDCPGTCFQPSRNIEVCSLVSSGHYSLRPSESSLLVANTLDFWTFIPSCQLYWVLGCLLQTYVCPLTSGFQAGL